MGNLDMLNDRQTGSGASDGRAGIDPGGCREAEKRAC